MSLKKEWKSWREISKDFKIGLRNSKSENTLYYLRKLPWLKITDKRVLSRAREGSTRYRL